MINKTNNTNAVIDRRSDTTAILAERLNMINMFVNNSHIPALSEMNVKTPSVYLANRSSHIDLFKLDKIIYNENEDTYEKLVNVFSAMNGYGGSVSIIIQSDGSKVDFYFATHRIDSDGMAGELLQNNLKGNFPGCSIEKVKDEHKKKEIFASYCNLTKDKCINSLSVIPNRREFEMQNVTQLSAHGIEKFIDTMKGKSYTVVFIVSRSEL
jgi:hypothetical protein